MSVNPLFVLRKELLGNPSPFITFHDSQGDILFGSLESAKYVKIGSMIFTKDSPTAIKSKRGSGPNYTIDAVAYLFMTPEIRNMSFSEYLQSARKIGVSSVSLVDRKDIISYIEEAADSTAVIDATTPLANIFYSFEEAAKNQDVPQVTASDTLPSPASVFIEPLNVTTRPARTINDLIIGGKDFSYLIEQTHDLVKDEPAPKAAEPISLIESIKRANISTKKEEEPKKAPSFTPIIIVPATPTALITMYNVKDFLQSAKYTPTVEAKQSSTSMKPSSIVIERTVDGRKRPCQIIDNPSRLSLEDWNKVVGVFVQGPSWQFKEWKWENPVELFQNVCGFYLHFDDTAPEGQVSSWNVHKLTISRSKRYLDSTAQLKFWEIFDRFLSSKR